MNLTEAAKKYEHYVTPKWAAEAILKKEILTHMVIDPCAGTGILTEEARLSGYLVKSFDIHPWGFPVNISDYLKLEKEDITLGLIPFEFSVFMNPPFSKAVEFVEKSFELGAKKVLCFQRLAFFCSQDRREFWNNTPPVRIHLCAERATCFRHDIPVNDKGKRINIETGKKYAETPTDHAWFVFERGHKGGTIIERLYKNQFFNQ